MQKVGDADGGVEGGGQAATKKKTSGALIKGEKDTG